MINPLWVMWFFICSTVFVLAVGTLIKYDDWEDMKRYNDWEEKKNCLHKKSCWNCVSATTFSTEKPCKECNGFGNFKCRICEGRKHV